MSADLAAPKNDEVYQIAIDGPVAAGKGTVAKLVAKRLGFLYVDTGATYRAAALLATRAGIPFSDEAAIVELVERTKLEMRSPVGKEQDGRPVTLLLDGEDVSWAIRTEEMSNGSSHVAVLPKLRQALVKKQQEIAAAQSVVMEGRDITYRVLPDAQLKIFLTGNDVVRAKRRQFQLLTKGTDVSFEEVYRDLQERDQRDMTRETDPLKQVSDALVIDTSDLSIEKVVEMIVAKAQV